MTQTKSESSAMAWKRLGLKFAAPGTKIWFSHAMLPTPILLQDRIRVFVAGCDPQMRGRIFYVDLTPLSPFDIIAIHDKPVLDLGSDGTFDCDGVNPSCIVRDGERILLYYIGWRRISSEVPYTLFAGLAVSEDEGVTFVKRPGPILNGHGLESCFRTAPFVWREENEWRMIYIGGGEFFSNQAGKRLPLYALREATSADGIIWPDGGREIMLPNRERDQIGFGRPVLYQCEFDRARIMLSIRTTKGYRLVAANWPSEFYNVEMFSDVLRGNDGWDSEMTCFGSILNCEQCKLLFYNGNQFGRTGFGLASQGYG